MRDVLVRQAQLDSVVRKEVKVLMDLRVKLVTGENLELMVFLEGMVQMAEMVVTAMMVVMHPKEEKAKEVYRALLEIKGNVVIQELKVYLV